MTANPFIKDVQLVQPKSTDDMAIVLLERVEPGVTPEYCVHGKTSCYSCQEWLWLGDQTYEAVATQRAAPLCMQCAEQLLPKDATPARNLRDHRRADGPH